MDYNISILLTTEQIDDLLKILNETDTEKAIELKNEIEAQVTR
jgi:hypothetical protein